MAVSLTTPTTSRTWNYQAPGICAFSHHMNDDDHLPRERRRRRKAHSGMLLFGAQNSYCNSSYLSPLLFSSSLSSGLLVSPVVWTSYRKFGTALGCKKEHVLVCCVHISLSCMLIGMNSLLKFKLSRAASSTAN